MGAMVYIISAHHLPGESLEQIIILIGAACRGKKARASHISFQPFRYLIESFLPRGSAEFAVLFNKWCGQARWVVDKLPGKTPLYTGAPLIERFRVCVVGGDIGYLASFCIDLHKQLTAHAAISADGFCRCQLPGASLAERGFFRQSAYGTDCYALTAEGAV